MVFLSCRIVSVNKDVSEEHFINTYAEIQYTVKIIAGYLKYCTESNREDAVKQKNEYMF